MDRDRLLELLRQVRAGDLTPDGAAEALATLPFEAVGGVAVVDHHRAVRTGIPEVVYGESKSAAQIADIMRVLARSGHGALATRVDATKGAEVASRVRAAEYLALPRLVRVAPRRPPVVRGTVGVVTAGTSDLPVSEEAAVTAEFLGCHVVRIGDVGIAGLHRLLARLDEIRRFDAVIVVAGMEGALPSVLGGLCDRPLIAVPTSVGYGVGMGGLIALGGMLASCVSGVTVVNVDNGFGAAVAAARIA
ncbi:MAG: nickel pincer cofactor biosynthesis protein LarB, partial [Myxococcales bacterium]|nr:nickel pincer cofactor biosynthesis protein LarB [Myxococcales bacterium]